MKTIKVKLFVGERQPAFLCALVNVMNTKENTDTVFYLWTQKLTLDRIAVLKVSIIYAAMNKAPPFSQPLRAEDIFFQGKMRNK